MITRSPQTYSPSPVTTLQFLMIMDSGTSCLPSTMYWIIYFFLECRKTGFPESAPVLFLMHDFAVLRLAIRSDVDLSTNTRAKLITFTITTSIRERSVSIVQKIASYFHSHATSFFGTVDVVVARRAIYDSTTDTVYIAAHLDIYTRFPIFPASCTMGVACKPRPRCHNLEDASCKN